MKKISAIVFSIILFLSMTSPALAAFGELKQELNDLKKDIKEEFKEDKFSTPGGEKDFLSPTPSIVRRQTVQDRLEDKIRQRFPEVLPYTIRKAEIVSISQTTVPSEIIVKENNRTITLLINEKTIILKKAEGQSSLTEFKVGDFVAVQGKWEDQSQMVLVTKVLRNVPKEKVRMNFWEFLRSIF